MVVGEASTRNIIGGMESTGGVRLHNHKRKLKQRFDIIKKLGQGTYGKVQLGINKETGQEVAIKTIKKCKIETEADLIRIRREIQIMSSVQHPNIIHIYEVFENKEKIVLVMEYAAGGDLFDYILKRGVLAEHESRLLFRQIAMAVYYCHKHQICHRDLKLENILLDQNCNAKIADFGLSNIFDERRLLKTFCGSPLYASPEIVRGIPYCGPEVDCWCLGVLLYALVYSAMPFDGSNFKRLVKQITQPDYYEDEKNKSRASGLIKQLLNISPVDRADIKRVCSHWWVNEGFEENCLDMAENLACQTPIRLDLLLALVPESASSPDNLAAEEQQPLDASEAPNEAIVKSQEASVPTRCHSEGSLMEIDVPVEVNEEKSPVGRWKKRKESAEPEPEYMVYSPTEESPPQLLQPSKSIAEKVSVEEEPATVAPPPEESNEVPKQPEPKELKEDEASGSKKEVKNTERRKSKIFETAEKFQTTPTTPDAEKKKIFIPGVNVGGAKRAFERKASLTSPVAPVPSSPLSPPPPSRVIIDVGQTEKPSEEPEFKEEDKKRAANIITGALTRTPTTPETNKLGLKIQLGPNDLRNATVSVSTPVDNKYSFENKPQLEAQAVSSIDPVKEPAKQSKMEITLKSATLPRPRKTSRAEITLSGFKAPETAFKSEVEAKIGHYPRKLRTLKSEIAFPVAAVVPPMNRSVSLENPQPSPSSKERIIPIQMETTEVQKRPPAQSLPPKPPASSSQRSMSQRSSSLSRQSTESDTDSALGSTTIGPEPIRKSPREYIIPIAVEGGGYVTPRSGSVEPEGKNLSSRMFGKPRRMSLLSDASEDDTLPVPRDNDDLLQRHMHRLRRPFRQMPEHADSLSSGEDDDDDDGFELLTAENLFSTLLSRVRSLTQRLNVDDAKGSGFPNSRLLTRMTTNPKSFGLHDQPLSRRISESQFRRSMSRERDSVFNSREFGRPGVPNSRESVFETPSSSGSSCNNSPRDKLSEDCRTEEAIKEAQESLEQNFTPSLARRLSRQFIEQTRQALARSPCPYREPDYLYPGSVLDQLENKRSALKRNIRRANSLLDSRERYIVERGGRRSISLFEDGDENSTYNQDDNTISLPKLLVRKKRDQPDKIQEEPNDDTLSTRTTTISSTDSCDTSPNTSCATITRSNNFENRMLAAENLIKESKLKNLSQNVSGDEEKSRTFSEPRMRSLVGRSTSLTREPFSSSPERSLLSKLFRGKEPEVPKVKNQKRISRFLRPDFFDTPREESLYVKEQEAQKAADNERRKSRFAKKKPQEIPQKELKNEANLAAKEEKLTCKSGFFQSLEKKLDKLRSNNEEKEKVLNKEQEKEPEKELDKEREPEPTAAPPIEQSKTKMASVLELFKKDINKEPEKEPMKEREPEPAIAPPVEPPKNKIPSVLELFKKDLSKEPEKEPETEREPELSAAPPVEQPKTKMASVLELFRNEETKSQEKVKKKSPVVYRGSKSEGVSIEAPSGSKIPTKLVTSKITNSKTERNSGERNHTDKITEKSSEKSVEKVTKKSPPLRTSPETSKSTKLPKKSPEKTLKKDGSSVKVTEVNKSPEKVVLKKKKSSASPEVKVEKDKEEKKETKKVLVKKKVVKPSEGDEKKEETEEKKKKKIVRVVKKVVKKTDEKTNGEGKTPKAAVTATVGGTKKEPNGTVKKRRSPETSTVKEVVAEEPKIPTAQKKNRSNLKLDFSKIPQHSAFRNSGSSNSNTSHQLQNGSVKKQVVKAESLEKIDVDKTTTAILKEVERTGPEKEFGKGEENHVEEDTAVSEAASPDVTLREVPLESPLVGKRDVISDRSTAEDIESLDSWSVCSADVFGSRAPSELHSPTSPTYSSFYLRGDTQESIIDRIRRKSFYSRFNDRKKKTPLTSTPSAICMTSSLTLPRKFSFGSSRCSAGSGGYSSNRRSNPEKCYSLYGEEDMVPIRKKSPKSEKDRYSDSSSVSSFSDHKNSTGPSTSHEPLLRYPKSSRKYSSLDDNSLLSSRTSTLPRKYKYSTTSLEPKTVKYFEDLLAPPTQDAYGSSRCSPISDCKNGYHNGKQETVKDEPKNDDLTSFRNYASSTDYFDPPEHRID